jgi:hypothetical protein
MYIEAKVMGGESIEHAAHYAIALANRIQCDVHFTFNEVTCMAIVGHYPSDLVRSWWDALQSPSQHKIATSHPRPAASASVTQEKS